ncbi:MAG: dienelactone hydrolase family protein [Rubrivivax sp.]|nr:dienelactone hydrolase family protein [Rubrivivax sp.]
MAPAQETPPTRRLTARDFHPEVMRLFDQYVHGLIDRRGFLDGASRHAALAGTSAALLLEALNPKFAQAQQVKPDDARIDARFVEIASPAGYGKVRGYLVRPKAARGRLPGVLVVHENRGLNPHIEDVARRVALANFVAFAPDALFPLGGYPGDEDKARAAFAQLEQPKTREDFVAAAEWLRTHADVSGKVGVVGFCYGGSISNLLATRLPWLSAAVPFYGSQPPAADVPKIKAAVQIHYAGNDERINAGAAAYEQALKAAGVRHEVHLYPNTQHGFHNDTTPRFDEAAAKLAWQRTVAFFEAHLRG